MLFREMRCCLFKKSRARRPVPDTILPFPGEPLRNEVTVRCGRCREPQSIPDKAIVMVCSNCCLVNRVQTRGMERRLSFIDCDIGDSEIMVLEPAVFQLGEAPDRRSIPICSVCLEGVGDIILEPCGHGGICEDCARHIALNKAVGGPHCPLDKRPIDHILRIGELHPDFVKARTLELPELAAKEPPRVPPPLGLRKAKDAGSG
jgi:hypothetical protein